ncbi:MAG TPA: hypothetical protein GXZ66_09125 [Clostridiaceae bacterium]|jgi:hypothetical protein|nr:hypothetical protein [Clostridiaceae bacterium]
MNLYILVEGRRTESIVYPSWLGHLLPGFKRLKDPFMLKDNNVKGNHYYLFDGGGYPNMLKDAVAGAMDINEIGAFDYYIICLDTDDEDCYEREQAVLDRLKDNGVEPKAELVVITQKVCIESWFLGNRELVKKSLRGADIEKYINFYNVGEKDPELMPKPIYSTDSIAMFHYKYLRTLMKKNGMNYTKGRPYEVCSKDYLTELILRSYYTGHLESFSRFVDLCMKIKERTQLP